MRLHRTLILLAVLASRRVHATTYVVPPDEALIARADAIVIARALHSFVREPPERGIETVTDFSVEETLEGDVSTGSGIRVRAPGGTLDTADGEIRITIIPGAPRFVDGDRVLLFLKSVGSSEFAATDLALGVFRFAADDAGRHVLIRNESEISGWDPDGSAHREPRRDAARFLQFIRAIIAHRSASRDYVTEANALVGENRSLAQGRVSALSLPSSTQYTFASQSGVENSTGVRWKTFPSAVNWNRGNSEINASNGGTDAILAAFNSWNSDVSSNVNLVLATAVANPNGIKDSIDGVNNIVFEKDSTAYGVLPYNCTTGGVLGSGGVHSAATDAMNTVNGETFLRITEGDVSMNQGAGACLPGGTGTLSMGNYFSVVTHEVGHCLGFRHSDNSRDNSQPCVNLAGYDCSSAAIMNHILINGLGGVLTSWDQRAVERVYPAPPAPANVLASATTPNDVSLSWTAVLGAASYTIYRSENASVFSFAGTTATNNFLDSGASANTAYLYRVTTTLAGVESPSSNVDLATTVIFSDPTLTAGSTFIQVAHITEIRAAVDAVRRLANGGLGNNFNYTDPAISPASTPVRRIHIIELRGALDTARATLNLPTMSYSDLPEQSLVKAVDFVELRNGVQ
jgi:hypothetical protein